MPIVKFKHVLSFSSEDTRHPASNMLKSETIYKWKCASANERHASISIQLEKSSQINGIDIGNNGSAFVEVLVGRSSWQPSEEFKVLLVASSFMSPSESKSNKPISRVRMFGAEHLTKTVAAEKWDVIKVVCTQPYNQNEGYGLSFIKLSSPQEKQEEEAEQEKTIQLGRFKLRSNSDDESEDVSAGSFFQNRMNIAPTVQRIPKPSIAAVAREASKTPITNKVFQTKGESTSKMMSVSNDRRQEVASALLQGSPAVSKATPSSTSNSAIKATSQLQRCSNTSETPKRKKEVINKAEEQPSKKIKANQESSARKVETKVKKCKVKKRNVSYRNILNNVTFALSGYQNPERGNIRDLGLAMGARYEGSWNHKCTHLICAFANTPKFQQVKGKGKIVKKTWFDECHREKKRVNTKRHRLDGGGSSSYESTDDEQPILERNKVDSMQSSSTSQRRPSSSTSQRRQSSECDTEDELEKIRSATLKANEANEEANKAKDEANKTKDETQGEEASNQQKQKTTEKPSDGNVDDKKDDLYDGTTEDEDDGEIDSKVKDEIDSKVKDGAFPTLPQLADFFDGLTFFLYGDFDPRDRRLLKRYVTAYSGTIAEYMSSSVDYVISSSEWDKNFDQAQSDKKSLIFLRPKWVFKCHEHQIRLPYEKYKITP